MSEADEEQEAEATEVVVNAYVVHTLVGGQTFQHIAEVTVGDRAELVLSGADGGCVAMFAPGIWRWVEVAG
jgi:hypothetical protein